MEESCPESTKNIIAYLIGTDSLLILPNPSLRRANDDIFDVRLRMDGIFPSEDQATEFMHEFEALYTNGPAGGGGIRLGFFHQLPVDILSNWKNLNPLWAFWCAAA